MKLSEYCDKKETLWYKVEQKNVEKLINYINNNIDDDLFKVANINDSLEVFNKLKVWLFKFYNKQLLDGLNYIGADYERFKKGLIYSLILGVTRNKSNTDLLYDVLKSANIIEKMIVYDDGTYILDDENNVIDFTVNLIMPKEQYYLLQEVNELNCISYKEYLEEKDNSIKFDESKTLYNLLRNAIYKQYLEE